jgi:hypothetical protein
MKKKVNEMEYVYAAILLHSAGKDIDDKAVSSVLKAAGVEADGARVKALVASLGSVDIDEAMATAVAARGRGGRLRRPGLPIRLKQRLERMTQSRYGRGPRG